MKFAIIGGGVAGLCAAIRLCEHGEEPVLIEGGSYPSHKICGEFLSPECLPFLKRCKIQPVPISQIIMNTTRNSLKYSFPLSAGGMSHLLLDPALAHHAALGGAQIKTKTLVNSFEIKEQSSDRHLLHLSSGETIEASNLIIATGKLAHDLNKPPVMSYMGFKTHFDFLPLDKETIEMFSFSGGYLGVSPIEDHKYNVACLADMKKVKGMDPLLFLEKMISQHPRLHSLLSEGKNLLDKWMVASLPAFGIKKTPDWPDAYFIGDAAVTIPPASGNGLSMAILGGCLAADYAVRQQAQDFKRLWVKRCSSQVFYAKVLHRLMLNPSLGAPALYIANHFPYLSRKFFELTRSC